MGRVSAMLGAHEQAHNLCFIGPCGLCSLVRRRVVVRRLAQCAGDHEFCRVRRSGISRHGVRSPPMRGAGRRIFLRGRSERSGPAARRNERLRSGRLQQPTLCRGKRRCEHHHDVRVPAGIRLLQGCRLRTSSGRALRLERDAPIACLPSGPAAGGVSLATSPRRVRLPARGKIVSEGPLPPQDPR